MILWIILAVVLVIIIFVAASAWRLLRSPAFVEPGGPYSVGTHLFEVKDNSRGGRRLAVHVFYPAEKGGSGSFMAAMDDRIAEAFSKLYKMPSFGSDNPDSHCIIDAPSMKGSFPVILFSHGAFSYSTQNLSTFEELASNGYIVFTISHTGEAALSLFPDDSTIEIEDPSILRNSMKVGKEEVKAYAARLEKLKSALPKEEKKAVYRQLGDTFYKGFEKYLNQRIDDFHFLLDEIKRLYSDESFPVAGRMDLDKIGMFGHSLGGITTAYLCSESDTPVRGGINFDAPVITFDERDPVPKKPFAHFYSTETSLPGSGKVDMTGTNDYYCEAGSAPCFSRTFEGSAHYNFSDFNFMPPILRFTPLLGSVDPMTMVKDLNEAVLDFFNYLLKDGEVKNTFSPEK